MICVYAINSTGSSWVARTLTAISQEAGGGPLVIEPFAPNAWRSEPSGPPPYMARIAANTHLLGHWPGRNETLTPEARAQWHDLFDAFTAWRPQAIGFKTLLAAHWEVIREHWPEVRFVRVTRGLLGYLCCIARRRADWFLTPWYYPVQEPPPWWTRANNSGAPERWLPLVRAAYLRSIIEDWRDAHEPPDRLRVSFEDLTCNWDFEWPRLFEFCGLPVPRPERLREIAMPVARSWARSPYTRAEIADVIAFLREKGDCRVD